MIISRITKYICFLLVVVVSFTACKKRKEQLIQGKWKMETYTLDEPTNPTYWIFKGDGIFSVINEKQAAGEDTAAGQYKIVMKSLVLTHMEIYNPEGLRGLWRIEKLNKKILVMARVRFLDKNNKSDPYLRREFTNVN